jgi:tetratricopeptide (TPR) repeat protein
MTSTNLTLELQPMDPPTPDATDPKGPPTLELVPAGPAGAPALAAAAAEIEIVPLSTRRVVASTSPERPDRFVVEAQHQYAEGHLDQPLWDRAFAQANGDKEAAVAAYLQARALALKLLDRERRSEKNAVAAKKVTKELDAAENLEDFDVDAALRLGRGGMLAKYRTGIIVAVIMVAAAVAAWFAYSLMFAKPPAPVRAAPAAEPLKARAPAAAATTSVPIPAVAPKSAGASPELLKKIQELRDAGSANVLVLYLVEWTRKEPANAEAWDQLRAGYASLKQYDDALAAAKKAQELMPDDARSWRNLGIAYADAGDPVAALKSFEQAVARDDRDAESFTRIGILNAQLSQLPEAGRAFDRALAISPGDHIAQCMRTAIAPLSSAPKDTYATAKQVKAIDAKCRGV